MPPIEIQPGVYWIGVNDRTTDLFEGLWPITNEGVSYNAYLIDDEKKVLIDLAKGAKTDEFFDQIAKIVDPSQIDFIVINHMEPDHTGVLHTFKKMSPNSTILCTAKAHQMLKSFYGVHDRVKIVEDGEVLATDKRSLTFYGTPYVHWPETMMTYESTNRILFSCDGFGGYGALRGALFDDECSDIAFYEREALRYFANIVGKYSVPVLKAIAKLASVPIDIVAPSHGLVWRRNPARIVELYRKWSQYASSTAEPGISLIYGSMYGNTEKVMNAVSQGISSEGVRLEIFDAARTHVSYLLPALWINTGVIVGAPTYEGSLFPPVAAAVRTAIQKSVKNKTAAMFGSYGWSGGALKELRSIVEPAKWEITSTFEFPGGPHDEDMEKAREFGAAFARKIKNGVAAA
jgi:flavorubredoxin